jgi:hypothetical protein
MRLPITEAAKRLRLSEQTVRRRIHSGELPGIQVDTPQGFIWMIELPDDSSVGESDTGEIAALRELIDNLNGQAQLMKEQLGSKDRQIEQLHVLLQQAQAALPAPREGKSWWKWWLK